MSAVNANLSFAPVLIVAGPTACGKSALALDMAEAFDGVVINADSMQVYSELRVLSARPDESETSRAPHRLYGVLSGREACSAGKWRDMAMAEINDCHAQGKLPIVTGGTGMYLNALTEGIAPIPDVPSRIRDSVTAELEDIGHAAFFEKLKKNDPETAATLDGTNTQRMIRAAEVFAHTGRGLASWHKEPMVPPPDNMKFKKLCYMPPRDILYDRCNRRFDLMLEQGAIDEVRDLIALGLPDTAPVMKAVGVRELGAYLAGEIDLATAREKSQRETRRYAKRQLTWFRHQMSDKEIIDAQYSESLAAKMRHDINQFLLTTPK
ncbi:tRNA (adenosine(37)-N6)-dimethylallyltransferase MiaA [Thalassospira sp. GO-4]|jgi:tRNA dimethylallyltransferase|uniref:tRNA (adenosine(37)-N6)-dimethylallyltransferase MiaA n=1 Tax=Thalassospira sp. GO-4 TaxID=2946605 RepID=UPI002024D8AB|nr:tRNA (adenosine(37)-N6)-dimethylallyltransferase MiaA [Thalassospira sp. GO-4]URK17748.1 tRNA (adenosine(37)-N6)-dimethylallyltransferase MiaA [Thalassospira sp. GO-4]